MPLNAQVMGLNTAACWAVSSISQRFTLEKVPQRGATLLNLLVNECLALQHGVNLPRIGQKRFRAWLALTRVDLSSAFLMTLPVHKRRRVIPWNLQVRLVPLILREQQ